MFARPVSSSRPRKTTPPAVPGRWRCVTVPATVTRVESSHDASCLMDTIPALSRCFLSSSTGWISAVMPVDAMSAAANSNALIPGRDGIEISLIPGSMPGRSWAAIPAAHRPSRRSIPMLRSAPAVASASTWDTLIPARRDRSAIRVKGPPSWRA